MSTIIEAIDEEIGELEQRLEEIRAAREIAAAIDETGLTLGDLLAGGFQAFAEFLEQRFGDVAGDGHTEHIDPGTPPAVSPPKPPAASDSSPPPPRSPANRNAIANRERVLEAVKANPGGGVGTIAKAAGLSRKVTRGHLDALVGAGEITATAKGSGARAGYTYAAVREIAEERRQPAELDEDAAVDELDVSELNELEQKVVAYLRRAGGPRPTSEITIAVKASADHVGGACARLRNRGVLALVPPKSSEFPPRWELAKRTQTMSDRR